jgi:hypothetical protein
MVAGTINCPPIMVKPTTLISYSHGEPILYEKPVSPDK